jgi:hypothetical protein
LKTIQQKGAEKAKFLIFANFRRLKCVTCQRKSAFRMKKLLLLAMLAIALPGFVSKALSQDTPPVWYMELPGLQVESYAALHESLLHHPRYRIAEACVPARVVAFELRPGQQPSAGDASQLLSFLSAKGFPQSGPLSPQTKEGFMQRCMNARLGL